MKNYKDLRQRSAKACLDIMYANQLHINLSNSFKKTISDLRACKENFTEAQLKYIEDLYEKYMQMGGFDAITKN